MTLKCKTNCSRCTKTSSVFVSFPSIYSLTEFKLTEVGKCQGVEQGLQ
jgi:hypothetical protein